MGTEKGSRRSRSSGHRRRSTTASSKSRSRSKSKSRHSRKGSDDDTAFAGVSAVSGVAREPRRIRDEGHEDEITVFDETQWSLIEKKTQTRGEADDAATQQGPVKDGEMVMAQTMDEGGTDGGVGGQAFATGNAEAQGDAPPEEAQAKAELDAFLNRRPWISIGLRIGAIVASLVAVSLFVAASLSASWHVGMCVAVVQLALIVLTGSFLLVGFCLGWHVAPDEDDEERRIWRLPWRLYPVMLDFAAVLTLVAAAIIAFCHTTHLGNGHTGLIETGASLLLVGAIAHAALAVIVGKGKLL